MVLGHLFYDLLILCKAVFPCLPAIITCALVVDSSILQDTLVAHTDAVWGIAIHSTRVQLLSCSADSTVRLWTPGQQKLALNNTFLPPTEGKCYLGFSDRSV